MLSHTAKIVIFLGNNSEKFSIHVVSGRPLYKKTRLERNDLLLPANFISALQAFPIMADFINFSTLPIFYSQ